LISNTKALKISYICMANNLFNHKS